jgi:broad specificity phosphatase PhoE
VLLLVRHGQASFGAANYDQLSPAGERQGRLLGQTWAERGFAPTQVISGSMTRQYGTARAISSGGKWQGEVIVDRGWNEFDHVGLVDLVQPGLMPTDPRDFQEALEVGMRAWADGGPGGGESFTSFRERVEAAAERAVSTSASGGSTVVVSSGGVISWLAARLLGGGIEQWIRLNRVSINASVTKFVCGRQGVSLVSYNEHGHLSGPALTYR